MRIRTSVTPRNYMNYIGKRLDGPLILGCERFTGWSVWKFFSVSYYSGREFGKRNYPIFNKAMGVVTEKNGGTEIVYCIFPGLTDPISLLLLFLGSLLIFAVVGAPMPILFALGWTVLIALHTALFTVYSASGKCGREKLQTYFQYSTY